VTVAEKNWPKNSFVLRKVRVFEKNVFPRKENGHGGGKENGHVRRFAHGFACGFVHEIGG
jgi:hypothetical protein